MDELVRLWGENLERGRRAHKPDGTPKARIDDGEPCMSQARLAELCGVRQSTVARWESGTMAPRDQHKLRLAVILHQDVRQLFPLVRVAV